MIQRKQSIYLFLIVAIGAFCLITSPAIYKFTGMDLKNLKTNPYDLEVGYVKMDKVQGDVVTTVAESMLLSWNMVMVLVIALVSIFLYGNRARQLMLCRVNFIFILLFPVLMYFAIQEGSVLKFDGAEGKIALGMFYPVAILILNFLAVRGIKADEALIRSMNRIR